MLLSLVNKIDTMKNIPNKQESFSIHSDLGPQISLDPPFYLAGKVVKGDGRGHELGFPTVNIHISNITIPYGVYVVLARFQEQVIKGVAHIGSLQTFNIAEPRCEVHLFNFEGNLYDKRVEVNLLHFLRDIEKFESEEALVTQIQNDIIIAKNFLKNI